MASDNKNQAFKCNQQVSSAPPLVTGSPSQKVGKSKKSTKKLNTPTGSPTGNSFGKSTSAGVSYSASCLHCQHVMANKVPQEKQANGPPPFGAVPCNTVTCSSQVAENMSPMPQSNFVPPQSTPSKSPTLNDDNIKKVVSIGKLVSSKFIAVMELQRELDRKLKLCLAAKSGQQKAPKGTHGEQKPAHPEVKGATRPPKDKGSVPPVAAPTPGPAVNTAGINVDVANARKSHK